MLCATGRKACRPEPFGGRAVGAAAGEGGGGGGGGGAGGEGVGRAAREDQYMAAGGGGGGAGAGVPIVQDAEVQRTLKAQGMTKTVKKKPGLNSAELMVEASLRFATCMRAQAVENSKAQVALIDTQLQMAREQKEVRAQLVQMQQLMAHGFNTATGLASAAADAAGEEVGSPPRSVRTVSGSSSPDESAAKIQAAFRGKREREALDQAIEEGLQKIETSAVEIQRHW